MSYLLEMDMRKLLDLLTHLDGFFFSIPSCPEISNIRGSQVHLSTGLPPPSPSRPPTRLLVYVLIAPPESLSPSLSNYSD